jgi:hypothetical protein
MVHNWLQVVRRWGLSDVAVIGEETTACPAHHALPISPCLYLNRTVLGTIYARLHATAWPKEKEPKQDHRRQNRVVQQPGAVGWLPPHFSELLMCSAPIWEEISNWRFLPSSHLVLFFFDWGCVHCASCFFFEQYWWGVPLAGPSRCYLVFEAGMEGGAPLFTPTGAVNPAGLRHEAPQIGVWQPPPATTPRFFFLLLGFLFFRPHFQPRVCKWPAAHANTMQPWICSQYPVCCGPHCCGSRCPSE